jgi:hypothetical protein
MKLIATLLIMLALSLAGVSAHVIRGLFHPTEATAFVSSPSATADRPLRLAWAGHDTGLGVACFFVANTSPPRAEAPEWPRVTAVGFELPGNPRGFVLVSPLDEGWDVVEGVDVAVPGHGVMTVDVALVAPANPTGRERGNGGLPAGIRPGQVGMRGNGTRFCLSGPFPDDPAAPTPPALLPIEQLINGVVVRFHGVEPHGPSLDLGVWENTAQRPIPLYP